MTFDKSHDSLHTAKFWTCLILLYDKVFLIIYTSNLNPGFTLRIHQHWGHILWLCPDEAHCWRREEHWWWGCFSCQSEVDWKKEKKRSITSLAGKQEVCPYNYCKHSTHTTSTTEHRSDDIMVFCYSTVRFQIRDPCTRLLAAGSSWVLVLSTTAVINDCQVALHCLEPVFMSMNSCHFIIILVLYYGSHFLPAHKASTR